MAKIKSKIKYLLALLPAFGISTGIEAQEPASSGSLVQLQVLHLDH